LPATPTVVVPKERPPTPPAPHISLFDLKPVTAKNGHGKLGINKSNEGKPLTVEGKVYERGLGAHANALFVYKIPAGAKRFVAIVGLDDEKKDDERSSVTFEVLGDVKEMGEEPELLAKSPVLSSKTVRAWAFNVELNERHKELRLVIGDAGDGIASDHADIVAAGFVK
jgi:alpha-galactosidase